MELVSSADILRRLNERTVHGHHVDARLIQAVKMPGTFFLLTLDDEQTFLSLIWQEIDPTRLLTPHGQPRTLGDVANRMIRLSWTFASLSNPMGLPPTQHVPAAFESFEKINSAFNAIWEIEGAGTGTPPNCQSIDFEGEDGKPDARCLLIKREPIAPLGIGSRPFA
jgi:hypothetical protein